MERIPAASPNGQDSESIVLYLIAEDLKSRYFFNGLRNLALDDQCYQPDLAAAILALLGLSSKVDEHLNMYCMIADSYSSNGNHCEGQEEWRGLAVDVYDILRAYRPK